LLTESPFGLLFVLVALKTLADVGGALARSEPLPERPPAWASRLAARVAPAGRAGTEFDAQRRREIEDAKHQAQEDEEPV
jgi:hypothetical protein